MENIIDILKRLRDAIYDLLIGGRYVWPLSKSFTPDEMNTSFGPRVNKDSWDFHDGIDLPAPIGTKVFAMRGGKVHRAGPGGTDGFSSRHVVLETNDPRDGLMYLVYLHLDSIDPAINVGMNVSRGRLLGRVGADDATYPHLHMEFRKGTLREIGSVHPLGYLPYANTANFSAPVADRFNRFGSLMAARLRFGSGSKLEGDLRRVEVEIKRGATLLETRIVDFNDKETINEGNSDGKTYKKDIGVEGYQKSDMVKHNRSNLEYGIVVRDLPNDCDSLVARVIDVGNNTATGEEVTVPNQTATDEFVNFEDGQMPPAGWKVVTSSTGAGTTVANDATAAHSGLRGMLCVDRSTSETATQRAGLEHTLPAGRFEWVAEGWFNPTELSLAAGQSVFLLYFLSGDNLSAAARIHNSAGSLRAGIVVKQADGSLIDSESETIIAPGVWRKWRLRLLRIATRETTAVLSLDEGEKMVEQTRIDWDSTAFEPLSLRAGIGLSSVGATATVMADELRLTESQL